MIATLLVANRGEIACRILRTARAMGLRTVAVYSDADVGARHVRLADRAVRIGTAAPGASYLSVAALLEAARATGADAIHPGYGFLSENAPFAAACAAAELAFVGPPASVIASMGSKSAAKEAMQRAGVPVLPGYHGADQSLERLESEAHRMGFPLIVKPSGGGGGKGMQIVTTEAGLRDALEAAQRIAVRSFGDATLLLERYLPRPRHVEVQILADSHGNVVHLHDRDCSVQRRHQKLIEEAPAPDIPREARARLHAAAVTVARSIGYVNAGTVEFLYADGEFYFMEMNTRLQVEHPVTEAVTGLDLVEWQLRIAAGERLAFSQDDVSVTGCAIEARVCAEDPAQEFTPSAGRLLRLDWPPAATGVRADTGFETGDEVPSDYDSLLGKVIAVAPARRTAAAALAGALSQMRVVGVACNAGWLAQCLRTRTFLDGPVTTRFLEDEATALLSPGADPAQWRRAAAVAALVATRPAGTALTPWQIADAFRIGRPAAVAIEGTLNGLPLAASVAAVADGWEVRIGDGVLVLGWLARDESSGRVTIEGVTHGAEYQRHVAGLELWLDDVHWTLRMADAATGRGPAALADELTARLPGTVARVLVTVGDTVAQGQPLLVVEAMKMEHTIRAPHAGTVIRIAVRAGERVAEGLRLADLSESAG
jgi:acetyl/propionyl-CoA carboxylase alpha subunit